MPDFEITAPDGRKYRVTAPEGASQDEVLAYAQRQFSSDTGADKGFGLFRNTTAGVNESIAGTLGAPADIAARLINAGIGGVNAALPGEQNVVPSIDNPVLGSEWWKNRMGNIGADPRDVQAVTTDEKLARGTGRGVMDAASMLVPASLIAKGAKAGTMTKGVAESLAAQPATQLAAGGIGGAVTESTDSPALGTAAAISAPLFMRAGGILARPTPSRLTPEQTRLANIAAAEGIPLTAGQETGSRPLQTLESVFSTLPLTSRAQSEVNQDQARAFTKAVLGKAGIAEEAATPEVLEKAYRAFQNRYQGITSQIKVAVDNDLINDLASIEAKYAPKLGDKRSIVDSYLNDIVDAGTKGNGLIDGEIYQAARSNLRSQSNSMKGSDSFTANVLREIRTALDNAANRSMPPALKPEWQELNRQYGNYKTIEKAMNSTTNAASAGFIPPTGLSQAVQQSRPGQFSRGAGEMNDLARVGTTFVRDPVPNSGTPERGFLQDLLTGRSLMTMGGVGGGATMAGASPVASAAMAGAALAAPKLAQVAYQSGPVQSYLRQSGGAIGPKTDKELLAALLTQQLLAGGP